MVLTYAHYDPASLIIKIMSMKEYKYIINGTKYDVQIGEIVENIANVTVNGEEFKVEMEKQEVEPKKKVVVKTGGAAQAAAPSADAASNGPVNTNNALKAPLPGVITDIKVAVGDEVKVGDTVVVLEAMKMANNLDAEKAGKVTAILVKVGDSVMEDSPLVVIE